MPFVETPLTDRIRDAVAAAWDVDSAANAQRLFGGEESAAFRVGDLVIRIGPTWRTIAELEWCHAIAAAAAGEVPEAVAPLIHQRDGTVVRVDGRPVSVWPHVEGTWVDDDDDAQWLQAADLLARLHRALAGYRSRFGPRPPGGGTVTARTTTGDDELDRWIRSFDDAAPGRQALHGDFYAGNMLARDGRIVALLDWDEAILGPPERELAWAAWEFGDGLWADDLDDVRAFMQAYRDAGGPAEPLDDVTMRQLVRQRLLGELDYVERQSQVGQLTDEDLVYRDRQVEVVRRLRP